MRTAQDNTTPLSIFPSILARTVAVAIALALILLASASRPAPANAQSSAAPAASAGDPDLALRQFLQKRFRISDLSLIKLSPAIPAGVSNLTMRQLTVSNEQGQSVQATLFQVPGGNRIIMGQIADLGADPWNRQDLKQIHLDDRPVLGDANSPVTIVEFADFECPYCAHAFSVLEALVQNTYKGKVRLIFK